MMNEGERAATKKEQCLRFRTHCAATHEDFDGDIVAIRTDGRS
jgi:hypothetical protein